VLWTDLLLLEVLTSGGRGGHRSRTPLTRVDLQPEPTSEETVTVVATTRANKRLEDQPMCVEVLAREEIEEKMLMTPGDIAMMLNEMGGMRVQATSPSLGAASVRIQRIRPGSPGA
jgi:outer membrane receptor for ferrienterochelin and colicins